MANQPAFVNYDDATNTINVAPTAFTDAGVYNFQLTRSKNLVSKDFPLAITVTDPCEDDPAVLTLGAPFPYALY